MVLIWKQITEGIEFSSSMFSRKIDYPDVGIWGNREISAALRLESCDFCQCYSLLSLKKGIKLRLAIQILLCFSVVECYFDAKSSPLHI